MAEEERSPDTAVASKGSSRTADVSSQFPYRLHRLLNDAETKGFSDVVCWAPSGKSFRVLNKDRFEKEVMPLYFTSSQYKSFQRSLNLWQFLKNRDGQAESGNIANPFFVRNQPELCEKMTRVKNKGLYRRVRAVPTATDTNVPSVVSEEDRSTASSSGKSSPSIKSSVPSFAGATTNFENAANKILLGIQLPGSPAAAQMGGLPQTSSSAFAQVAPSNFLAEALRSIGTGGNMGGSLDLLQNLKALTAPAGLTETLARLTYMQEKERLLQQAALMEQQRKNSTAAREQDALAGLASLAASAPPAAQSRNTLFPSTHGAQPAPSTAYSNLMHQYAAAQMMENKHSSPGTNTMTSNLLHEAQLRRAFLQSLANGAGSA